MNYYPKRENEYDELTMTPQYMHIIIENIKKRITCNEQPKRGEIEIFSGHLSLIYIINNIILLSH